MNRIVYSTGAGRICPDCSQPVKKCRCRAAERAHGGRSPDAASPAPARAGDGRVRVRRETKGRKGKGVTVVTGVPLAGDELAELGAQLKRRCGAGGTVKDGTIEIQGDHRDVVVSELQKRGWDVKRAGG
ncbi:MAG: translation initiation factor [Gemmatimonadota bacterium]|nr:MAG: translation initiation factor [Gemmatimonadota bacterium]